jgi:hypothetical protein
VKTGRPRKSARENHLWFARYFAQVLREAIRRTQEFDLTQKDGAEFQARGRRASNAWQYLSVLLCNFCDPNAPSKFLRQVADELEGKLNYSPADEKIFRAALCLLRKGGSRTLEKLLEELGKNPLSRNSSLRRSVERLGIHLDDEHLHRKCHLSVHDMPLAKTIGKTCHKGQSRSSHRRRKQ